MNEGKDPYDLERFVRAQEPVIEQVRAELRSGSKRSHWMWFVFPQLKGLGSSAMAARYGITSKEETNAYLGHPLLGPRLRECTQLVNEIENRSIEAIFGYPDDLKFRSSMTLFAVAGSENDVFLAALQKYFGGELDGWTVARLSSL